MTFNIDPLKEILGFELDNSMQDYVGEDFNLGGNHTLYLEKDAEEKHYEQLEHSSLSREELATDDIKGVIRGKAVNLPGFNNSFDFNRSQDSITAKLLANTVSSPKKVGNNILMPEINLMLNGKALID